MGFLCARFLRVYIYYTQNNRDHVEMSIVDILIFALTLLIFTALGSRVSRLKCISVENIVISACLGLSILSLSVLLMGVAGLLYASVAASLILAAFIFSYRQIIDIVTYLISRLRAIFTIFKLFTQRILVLLFVFFCIVSLAESLAPETGNDALAYHLAHPKIFVNTHMVSAIEYSRESLWPYFTQMLFTLGLLLRSQALAKLFHFGSALLLSAGIYAFCARYFSRFAGLLACVIFFSTPAIFTQAGYAYVDIMMALYAFMSLYLLLMWHKSAKNSHIILSGIFCGVALSIKYLGIFVFICMVATFFYLSLKARRKGLIKALILFSAAAAAVASLWYLRSYMATGNPFYPFLHKFFSSAWDNPAGISIGAAKDLKNLILLPWNITVFPLKFGGEAIGAIYLMLLPFIFLRRDADNFKFRAMIIFMTAFTLMWFVTSQMTRFIFTVLPILAIIESASMVNFFKDKRRGRNIVYIALSLALAFNAAIALYHLKGPAKVVMGTQDRDAYLVRNERSYSITTYINKTTPLEAKIFTQEPRIYYCDRKIVYSGYYLNCKGLKADMSLKDLAPILRKDGFTEILLSIERPFDKEDGMISSSGLDTIHEEYFIENTPEDRRYILLKL